MLTCAPCTACQPPCSQAAKAAPLSKLFMLAQVPYHPLLAFHMAALRRETAGAAPKAAAKVCLFARSSSSDLVPSHACYAPCRQAPLRQPVLLPAATAWLRL